jgi:hypothetical protein
MAASCGLPSSWYHDDNRDCNSRDSSEIGDFKFAYGFSSDLLNFIVALTAVIGGIVGFLVSSYVENIVLYILPFAGGSFTLLRPILFLRFERNLI